MLAAIVLAGCSGSTDGATGSIGPSAGPYPAEYRKIAQEYVRSTFKDPYTIRDAYIAPPKLALGPSLLGTACSPPRG